MARRPARDLSVGVVMALALLILAVGVMSVGEQSQLFAPKSHYHVSFPDTDGLRIGSPVRMAGVQVGSVAAIRLPTEPGASGIDVELAIASAYDARIRENSEASLRYLQLLSGEKYVDVAPGNPDLPQLSAGSTIPTKPQTELLQQGADIAENMNEITASLKEILAPLQRGEGLLGQMIQNPEFGKKGVEAIDKTAEDLEVITNRIRHGQGFVGRILFDKEFASRVDDLSVAMKDFASVLEAASKKEGALGALLKEGGPGEQAVKDFRDAAASLKRAAARLDSTDNFIGKLLNDPQYSEQVSGDLLSLLENLREITAKINRGEGTIGALVNDRTVYNGMEDVMAGVNDSKFARWLLRKYQRKGIEKEEEEHKAAEGGEAP